MIHNGVWINVTNNRLTWLSTLDKATEKTGYFIRDCGETRHTLSNRRMPETVYVWLIEHHLIEVDCGNIWLSEKGKAVLAQAFKESKEDREYT